MKNSFRRIFALALCFVLAATTLAVAPTAFADNTVKSDEMLTVVVQTEPTVITGLNGQTTEAGLIIAECFGGTLYEYRNGEITPSIATSYDTIDETHYRFHLREDACFADKTPVTAADVLFSYTAYVNSGIQNALYFNMDEFVVEDDHTIVIAFKEYVPGWLAGLAEGSLPIFSEAGVEAVGGLEAAARNCPVSCGRYNVAEWKNGEYILLERNENYWDPDYVGYYKYIKFLGVPDPAARLLAVQSGDANVAFLINTADYIGLAANPTVDGVVTSETALFNLILNGSSEKLQDPRVREAIAYATDAESINILTNMGSGKVAQGLFPESFPYYHEVFEGGHLPYDVEKAKSLLAEAGVSNLTLHLPVLASNQNIATIVKESMRQAGIEVEIEICEQNVYVETARSGKYDIQIGGTDYTSVTPNCFNQWDPSMVGKSIGSIYMADNAELADMAVRGRSSDEATCAQAFSDVIDYVIGGNYIIGLCTRGKFCAVTAGLQELSTGTRMNYIDVSYMHP